MSTSICISKVTSLCSIQRRMNLQIRCTFLGMLGIHFQTTLHELFLEMQDFIKNQKRFWQVVCPCLAQYQKNFYIRKHSSLKSNTVNYVYLNLIPSVVLMI